MDNSSYFLFFKLIYRLTKDSIGCNLGGRSFDF